jgi:hypothetical protein
MRNGLISEASMGPRVIYRTTFKGNELKDKHMRLQRELDDLHKILCDIAE